MYKFNQNDIFYNTVTTYPKYVVTAFKNNSYINNQITEGSNKISGTINYFETNNAVTASGDWIIEDKNFSGGQVLIVPVTFSQGQGTSSISRSFIRKSGTQYDKQYSTSKAAFKLISSANTIKYYSVLSPYYDMSYFLNTSSGTNVNFPVPNYLPPAADLTTTLNPATDINIIEIPSIFYGRSINPGTIDLQFYITGTLIARAQDINLNGELIQTTGSTTGNVIGVALYNEGVLFITGSSSLGGSTDYYIQPTASAGTAVSSAPRWIHYWSYKNIDAAKPVESSSFIMSFEGTEIVPTLTMLAHANKNDLNWSNNFSYVQSSSYSKYLSVTNSMTYIENSEMQIKNTISSSFSNYSASFQPQTFINTIGIYSEDGELIGIASLANPVRKTNEQDYTFKLKIDL